MKHFTRLYTLIAVTLFFFFPQVAFADVNVSVTGNSGDSSVHVDQQSQGQSTTCVNGNCTTTGGQNHATVCVNGNCTNSDSGNVNVQSDDGHSQVNISSTTSPTATPDPLALPTLKAPTITPDPTIIQMRKDLNNNVKQKADAVKKHVEKQENALSKFFREQVASLNNLFKGIFK